MRRIFSFLPLALLLALPLFAQSPRDRAPAAIASRTHGQKLHVPGIHNAGKITESLYRGAQPHKEGFTELKKIGITTIVDLRGEDAAKFEWERRTTETLGVRFVHIPVSGWSPPTDEQVAQFLSLFQSDPQQKIFVHCRLGDDRTGVFVAAYRMALEKWTPDQALNEMYFFHFNGFWHPAMKSFIHDFPARLHSSPALSPFRSVAPQL